MLWINQREGTQMFFANVGAMFLQNWKSIQLVNHFYKSYDVQGFYNDFVFFFFFSFIKWSSSWYNSDWIITLNNFNISLIIVTLKKFYNAHWYANWLFNKFLLVRIYNSSIYLRYHYDGSQSTSDRQTDRKIIFGRSMQLFMWKIL